MFQKICISTSDTFSGNDDDDDDDNDDDGDDDNDDYDVSGYSNLDGDVDAHLSIK